MKTSDKGARQRKTGSDRLSLYQRCQEAIDFLIECNGHTTLTKAEFATAMAARCGRRWLKVDGSGNRKMVEDVMNITRDQDLDPTARALFSGYVVAYAPNLGGMTLVDPSGELALDHQLHILNGDLQRQQTVKTTNRRRLSYWRAAAENAMKTSDYELARLLSHVENEIDASGFVSDNLVADYMKALTARGVEA